LKKYKNYFSHSALLYASISMNTTLRSLCIILGLLNGAAALAQTPTLEFAPGAGNPTTDGPSIADQVITFQNNANNPSSSTMSAYSPAITATFALSNQRYSLPTNRISTGTAVAFGGGTTATSGTIPTLPLFPLINAVGGSSNSNYTSASGVNGGIDVAANSGVEVLTAVEPLPSTVPANTARYQYADLTITFSRAMVNPVVHITGLGGSFSTNNVKTGYSTELDLVTTGVTLSKLSGSTELNVNSLQILNSAAAPDGATGAGAASGSVLVTTPATGITKLVFRLYLRPAAAGGTIHGDNATTFVGDGWLIGVSQRTPLVNFASLAPLPVQLTAFTAQAVGNRTAQLDWTTGSELNNAYFEVERSLDGSTFAAIGRVAGQGNKANSTTYTFADQATELPTTGGTVYYRLKQVDTNGTAIYSPVRTLIFTAGRVVAQVSLYPNPAQASTALDLSALPAAANYQVQVLDATGRQLSTTTLGGGQVQPLALDGLAPGLLTVLVTGATTNGTPFRQALRLRKD
jgi:hypothetical protein